MYFEKDYDENTYNFYEIDEYDAEYAAEELRNNLYARNVNLISEEGIIFQEKLIEDIDNFKSKGRETAAKIAYDEVFNDEDDEDEYGQRKLQAKIKQNRGKLTNWVNTEPTEKAKAFIEANKAKEPKKVGVFIANENFETTETEITIRKNKDGKWEVTAYDRYTGKTVKSKHSFKRWATSLRYVSAVYGDDIKRVPTSKNEIAQANASAKTGANAQANKQAKPTGAKPKASPAKETEAKTNKKAFDKSENNTDYIANKGFSTQEKTVSIIYNEDTGKYDVLTHDNYIDKDLPTRSFARFRGARKYAQNVFGELTKVENGEESSIKAEIKKKEPQLLKTTLDPITDDYINYYHLENQKIALTTQDILDFYNDSVNGKVKNGNMIFGRINDSQSVRIKNDVGINVKGYSLTINSSNMKHIDNRHIKNQSGQIPLKVEEIQLIPKIVTEYDEIEIQKESGKPTTLVFKKRINDKYLVATIVSNRKFSLSVQSCYITKKEESAGTSSRHAPSGTLRSTSETRKRDTDSSIQNIEDGTRIVNFSDNNTENVQPVISAQNNTQIHLVTDKEKNSAAKLIEAGADVSKPLKVRLKDVRGAFVAAVKETLPKGSKFRISAGDVRETMAEIDLVKDKKKTPIVAEHMFKRLRDINVTVSSDEGDEKMKLGDFMSPEQEKEAFGILMRTLNGKERPTELAKWAKSLQIEKMVNKQNVRTFRLLVTAKKRIANANKDYLSAPGLPPVEVGVYSKVFEGVKAPFTAESLNKLTDNVITLYTDENFGQMLTAYGLGLDETTQSLAKALADSFEDGKKINYSQIEMADAIVDLLNHEMSELAKGVRNANFEKARDTITIAQAAFINSKPSKLDPFKNALSHINNSIRSPIRVLEDKLSEFNPYVIQLEDGGKVCENAQRAKINEFNEMAFGKDIISECGFKNVDQLNRELNGKFMLHGYKITIAKALKIINTYKTAFFSSMRAKMSVKPIFI